MKRMTIHNPSKKIRDRVIRNIEMASQNPQITGLREEESGNDIIIILDDGANDWAAEGFDYIREYAECGAKVTVEE